MIETHTSLHMHICNQILEMSQLVQRSANAEFLHGAILLGSKPAYFTRLKYFTIVHFKRLGIRVSHDSFNQYVLFFSKQCTYCKTNAIYT